MDILICIIPKINPDAPTVGPSLLKSHLMDSGFSCEVLDLNIKLFNELKKNNEQDFFFARDSIFRQDNKEYFEESLYEKYEYLFLDWVEQIKKKNPKFLGMSLLSHYSHLTALTLSKLIKKNLPDIKIVWGGPEVSGQLGDMEEYKKNKVIDHYISGDGEQAIIDLLSNNLSAPGIDSNPPVQLDLSTIKIPNYDDIDWREYQGDLPNTVYITGSRGCVKKCTFCDVAALWPKYYFRAGESITKEIIHLEKKYNRKTFYFTDSLINGSLPAFNNLLKSLRDYRFSNPDSEIQWLSQWIVRSRLQMPEENFKLLSESGCKELQIGVESFSENVRNHMGKKFSDIDLLYCLQMLQKYKIRSALLMFVGYPTETEEDHQKSLAMISKLNDLGYFAANAIDKDGWRLLDLEIGNPFLLDKNMPIWSMVKEGQITNYKSGLEWEYKENTFPVRVRRLHEINNLVKSFTGLERSWLTTKRLEQLDIMVKKNYSNL